MPIFADNNVKQNYLLTKKSTTSSGREKYKYNMRSSLNIDTETEKMEAAVQPVITKKILQEFSSENFIIVHRVDTFLKI